MRTSVQALYSGRRVLDIGRVPRIFRADDEGVTTTGTSVAAHASANTKGGWVQISASTPIDADGFYLNLLAGTVSRDFLIDIGIGAAASEVVILPDLPMSSGTAGQATEVYVPLRIARGTRVAARCQATAGSAVCFVGVGLIASRYMPSFKRATTYGAVTADSGATAIDAGAVANTFGGWVQLAAALTNPMRYALVCLAAAGNYNRVSADYVYEIGVGAALSEVSIAGGMYSAQNSLDFWTPSSYHRAMEAPAGIRLAARARSSTTDAADRLTDIAVIGFD